MIPIGNATVDGTFAPLHFPEYRTTVLRNPSNDLLMVPQRLVELIGPVFGAADLRGEDGRPVPETFVEVRQANSAGR